MKTVKLMIHHTFPSFSEAIEKMVENVESVVKGEEMKHDPNSMVDASEVCAEWIEEAEDKEEREQFDTFFIVNGELMEANVTNTVMGGCGMFTDGSLKGTYFEF